MADDQVKPSSLDEPSGTDGFHPDPNKASICQNSPVPAGWVITGIGPTYNSCGATIGNPSTAWLIERYDNKPVGTTMGICTLLEHPIPPGWIVENSGPSQACSNGGPSALIRRVN